MPAQLASPRLTPTLALVAAWLAIYLLYLGVRPDPPKGTKAGTAVTTTTTATATAGEKDRSGTGR